MKLKLFDLSPSKDKKEGAVNKTSSSGKSAEANDSGYKEINVASFKRSLYRLETNYLKKNNKNLA